jgi:N-acetylmuramic acid 6-phosphate etherase
VVGLIAGGDRAIRKAVENAEDNINGAWKDLKEYQIDMNDTVIGIAASGTTPYVIGGIEAANKYGLLTACITCNANSPLGKIAQHEIAVVVGPEYLTGSTRMKSGTAQKMVLNMITTTTMIKLDRVKGNKMVDMQLSNDKLIDRGTRMIMQNLDITSKLAHELLMEHGSVRAAVDFYKNERK